MRQHRLVRAVSLSAHLQYHNKRRPSIRPCGDDVAMCWCMWKRVLRWWAPLNGLFGKPSVNERPRPHLADAPADEKIRLGDEARGFALAAQFSPIPINNSLAVTEKSGLLVPSKGFSNASSVIKSVLVEEIKPQQNLNLFTRNSLRRKTLFCQPFKRFD